MARRRKSRSSYAECVDFHRPNSFPLVGGPPWGISERLMRDIELYDATLRDGMGGGGMSLTAEEKLRVVHALDALGVHMIEAGFPASNPKELELFGLLAGETLSIAEIVAFGMTRRRDSAADADEGLRVLAETWNPSRTQLTLSLSGLTGKAYEMSVWNSSQVTSVKGGKLEAAGPDQGKLVVEFPSATTESYVHQDLVLNFAVPK